MPFKTFNDPIYGPIGLDLKLVKLIDTVQFQRLHHLRQLGVTHSVYPGASHTRFEHSIGTCHLAGELLERLLKVAKENVKEKSAKRTETDETIAIENEKTDKRERSIVDILSDDKDLLCVKMAALLHDLGHGPFSHFWESLIKKHIEILNENSTKPEILNENSTKHEIKEFVHEEMTPEILNENSTKHEIKEFVHEEMTPEILNENSTKHEIKEFVHEEMTIKFIEMMLKENPTIREELDLNEDDLEFIKELIDSKEKTRISKRSKDDGKNFFYEIVSNKKTGIDVDKWDYICRDSHHVGINTSFESKRLLKLCKVVTDSDKKTHIAWPEREFDNVLQMFEQRKRLHKKVYQHRVIKPIERLYIELFRTANEFLKVPSSVDPDVSLPILEAHKDPYTFVNMTDGLLQAVQLFDHPEAQKCKDLLRRIQKRDIGKIICEENFEFKSYEEVRELGTEFVSFLKKSETLQDDQPDIQFYITVLDFGKKKQDDANPMENVWLYTKDQNWLAKMAKNSEKWKQWEKMIPKYIKETSIFLSVNAQLMSKKEKIEKWFQTFCAFYKGDHTRKRNLSAPSKLDII